MKKALIYVVETSVAAILLWVDQRIFFLYFFFIVIWALDSKIDYLRKLIRVFQQVNEVKMIALSDHLAVPRSKVAEIHKQSLEELSPEQRESLQKDFNDILS